MVVAIIKAIAAAITICLRLCVQCEGASMMPTSQWKGCFARLPPLVVCWTIPEMTLQPRPLGVVEGRQETLVTASF